MLLLPIAVSPICCSGDLHILPGLRRQKSQVRAHAPPGGGPVPEAQRRAALPQPRRDAPFRQQALDAAPAPAATTTGTGSTGGTTGSDSGDYGTPYYWNDDDGDVWYWNGTYNEFIGYGDSYYIDDDGQYYESNDAGWEDDGYGDTFDYEEEYYEDYDPWSDPGDGWGDYDDYSYDDEGWGDYFD